MWYSGRALTFQVSDTSSILVTCSCPDDLWRSPSLVRKRAEFESHSAHFGLVAQPGRAIDLHPKDGGSNPLVSTMGSFVNLANGCAPNAVLGVRISHCPLRLSWRNWTARHDSNVTVVGSTPTESACVPVAQMDRALPCEGKDGSSTLPGNSLE